MKFLGSCPRAPCNPAHEQDAGGSNRLASCPVAVSKPRKGAFASCPRAGETYSLPAHTVLLKGSGWQKRGHLVTDSACLSKGGFSA